MAEENSPIKTLEGVKSFINQFPSINYGANAMPYLNIEGYGSGQASYNQLKADFDVLDLIDLTKSTILTASIKKKQNELKKLEDKISALHVLIGKDGTAGEGTTFHDLVNHLTGEVEKLRKERDTLEYDISAKEKVHENNLGLFGTKEQTALDKANEKIKEAEDNATKKINLAKENANQKVKLIEQFRDFLDETNRNMILYTLVILVLIVIFGIAVACSIPDLFASFESYNKFITTLGARATTWQILNLAFGLLIVKLPWALVLSAVFTGMYRLLKGILSTYEKINQDKRNMSAIYAVSGNIAQSLNEYGLAISNDLEWESAPEEDSDDIIIKISRENLDKKRESLKWNQIMNYFERMQQYKEDPVKKEDDNSKFEPWVNLSNKLIDRIPVIK
jgi:hypothetical protein